ncbi:MAG: DsrE family protein [Planctomycetes bacterium]|nr:DsrE family protein [Planctomycetota bacterium]
MGGKLADVEKFRKLRKNIVYFAPTSDDAVTAWKSRDDIDAWITWNVWCMPLRDSAKLVPVSREFRVYRQCSIAMSDRGSLKPGARRFVEFLTSPEGARIFESWGWVSTAAASRPLGVETDICAVCRITCDQWKDGHGQGLQEVRELLADYERLGIPFSEVHVKIVLDGVVAYWVLNDAAYARVRVGEKGNPNRALLEELLSLGVGLEICAQSMETNGWKDDDLLPGVKTVPGAYARIIDLQQQGYAYLQF